jgi:alkanesulfonate monooxygenase SsuD/methylene tetrahydromethanopterin reductase-like flavin-dependent oxidoreductase (luciferase family)
VDAVDRSGVGDVPDQAGHAGHPGGPATAGTTRPPSGHFGRSQWRKSDLQCGPWWPVEDEFASFGDTTDLVLLAEHLDEGLDLLGRYWSGEAVNHDGRHYQVRDVALLPGSVQRPRPPVWISGFWPHRRPIRRAARWDGVVPLFDTAKHGHVPTVDQVRDLVTYVRQHREARDSPFEIVLGGLSPGDPAKAGELIAPLAEAGATWWDERQLQIGEDLDRLTPVLRRIDQGPPTL